MCFDRVTDRFGQKILSETDSPGERAAVHNSSDDDGSKQISGSGKTARQKRGITDRPFSVRVNACGDRVDTFDKENRCISARAAGYLGVFLVLEAPVSLQIAFMADPGD